MKRVLSLTLCTAIVLSFAFAQTTGGGIMDGGLTGDTYGTTTGGSY